MPGAKELIAFAREVGLALALATSGVRRYADAVLAETGLAGSFAVEVTGEDVVRDKPAPDVFALAASRLGIEPAACVVFEDAPNGIAAAVAAGMRAVAVPNIYTRELAFPAAPEVVFRTCTRLSCGCRRRESVIVRGAERTVSSPKPRPASEQPCARVESFQRRWREGEDAAGDACHARDRAQSARRIAAAGRAMSASPYRVWAGRPSRVMPLAGNTWPRPSPGLPRAALA